MKILCYEIDKNSGEKAYYIVKHDVTENDLFCLALRGRVNPELNYYCTRLDETITDEEMLVLFKQKRYRKEPYFALIV